MLRVRNRVNKEQRQSRVAPVHSAALPRAIGVSGAEFAALWNDGVREQWLQVSDGYNDRALARAATALPRASTRGEWPTVREVSTTYGTAVRRMERALASKSTTKRIQERWTGIQKAWETRLEARKRELERAAAEATEADADTDNRFDSQTDELRRRVDKAARLEFQLRQTTDLEERRRLRLELVDAYQSLDRQRDTVRNFVLVARERAERVLATQRALTDDPELRRMQTECQREEQEALNRAQSATAALAQARTKYVTIIGKQPYRDAELDSLLDNALDSDSSSSSSDVFDESSGSFSSSESESDRQDDNDDDTRQSTATAQTLESLAVVAIDRYQESLEPRKAPEKLDDDEFFFLWNAEVRDRMLRLAKMDGDADAIALAESIVQFGRDDDPPSLGTFQGSYMKAVEKAVERLADRALLPIIERAQNACLALLRAERERARLEDRRLALIVERAKRQYLQSMRQLAKAQTDLRQRVQAEQRLGTYDAEIDSIEVRQILERKFKLERAVSDNHNLLVGTQRERRRKVNETLAEQRRIWARCSEAERAQIMLQERYEEEAADATRAAAIATGRVIQDDNIRLQQGDDNDDDEDDDDDDDDDEASTDNSSRRRR